MSNQSEGRYIIFYSNHCIHSQNVMKKLFKTPYYPKFMKICVDNKRNPIPPNVTCVPTIFLPGNPIPISGSKVFQWIEGLNSTGNKVNGNAGAQNISAFHSTEMSGFSDGYSFISDNSTNPLNHSFSFLGQAPPSISTPNESTGGSGDARNVQKSQLEQEYEKLMMSRDRDLPKPIARQ